jgi:sulfate/thiosulfate transport system substrate-binding protein
VSDGLDADVVTMNTTTDVDFLARQGLGGQRLEQALCGQRRAHHLDHVVPGSQRQPQEHRDWDDLVKPGIQVIVVNPKTGGNGRMAYLAAWGYVRKKKGAQRRTSR